LALKVRQVIAVSHALDILRAPVRLVRLMLGSEDRELLFIHSELPPQHRSSA
jgi:hypothetical protein